MKNSIEASAPSYLNTGLGPSSNSLSPGLVTIEIKPPLIILYCQNQKNKKYRESQFHCCLLNNRQTLQKKRGHFKPGDAACRQTSGVDLAISYFRVKNQSRPNRPRCAS